MDHEGLDFLEPNTSANTNGELADRDLMHPPPIQNFQTRKELLEHVRRFSLTQGYATAITDSRKDRYVTIGCDRGGTYRNRLNLTMDDRKRKACSWLIDCPFKLKGVKLGGAWVLQIKNGAHNHQASTEMSGHPSHRRLCDTELVKVKQMTQSGILPCQIVASLRQDNPDLQATSKTVSNAKAKIRKEMLGGRTPIQALLEELEKGGFLYDYKCDADKRLTHLFFSHPSSIKLSKSYSNVFVMDCTYKTNRFGMPLLDVIGVSSFNTSFYSCFAFLSHEGAKNYSWALNAFKNMLGTNEPPVIVSDRELALMNAIRVVFPTTTNILCCWHIEKNIFANCRKCFKEESEWDTFLSVWTDLIESDSEIAFKEGWKALEGSYKEKAYVINYIKRTWLPYKEKFVKAWTHRHLHFRNRVTSRAEGVHAALKVENNFHEIETRLGSEKMRIPHTIHAPLLMELVCRVSLYALNLLFQQYKKALSDSLLPTCTGYFVGTMGLPCAHVMRRKMNGVLKISDIHTQWRIDIRSLGEISNASSGENDKLKGLLQELENEYHQWPITRKEATHDRLSQFINPSMPVIFDPRVLSRRGRPSRSKIKKSSNSTRRDESAFEIAEKTRHCSNCGEVTHNCRTCPAIVANTSSQLNVVDRNPLGLLDLNSLPYESIIYSWD